jgi:hypothetical protein
MRVTSRYTLVASAFSPDPTVSEQAGQVLGAEPDPIYADYAEMVTRGSSAVGQDRRGGCR